MSRPRNPRHSTEALARKLPADNPMIFDQGNVGSAVAFGVRGTVASMPPESDRESLVPVELGQPDDGKFGGRDCLLGGDGEPVVAIDRTAFDRLMEAAKAMLSQLDYLQNLWGAEGVTNTLAERMRAAIAAVED